MPRTGDLPDLRRFWLLSPPLSPCGSTGEIITDDDDGNEIAITCQGCGGTGIDDTCSTCRGTGSI